MSETTLRRGSELALIAIASVWGLTFVMVQDAIALLPAMAFLAYRFIPASAIVAAIFRLFVVLTPVLGAIFLGERVPAVVWIAAGVSLVGLYLLSGVGGEFTWRGDGLVLLCAFSLAAHILATARAVEKYDVGALLAIAALAGQLEKPEGATVWSALIVTSLIASALGFFVQSFAQQHAPPARTALILASEPAFAGLFGWLLNDERLTARAGSAPG